MSLLVVIMGLVAMVLLVIIVTIALHKRAAFLANLLMSLALFLGRSVFIYYINPVSNEAVVDDQTTLNVVRNLLPYLLGYVILSALAVLVFNVVIPFIHTHFTIQRTPPGEKDLVVRRIEDYRRSA